MEDRFIIGAKKGLNIVFTLLLFFVLIYLSFSYSAQVAERKNDEVSDLFQSSALQLSDLLQEKVKPFPLLLRSARGVVLGEDGLTPDRWSHFVDSLDLDYHAFGIIGLTFTESVSSAERQAYLQEKRLTFPDFRIFPEGKRNDYMVVVYLAPESVSARVRGFDIGVETFRRNAAEKARISGSLALSRPISLLPTEKRSLDYLLLLPVSDKADFIGWTTLGFSISRLVDQAMKASGSGLYLEILDARHSDDPIYQAGAAREDLSGLAISPLKMLTQLELGDQQLNLVITPAKGSPYAALQRRFDRETLLVTMALSVLIALVVFLLLNSRFAAVRLANRLLDRFAESENRYRALFELSPEAIIIHRRGRVLLANKAAQRLMGVDAATLLVDRDIMDFVDDASRELVADRMKQVVHANTLPFVEETLKRHDGSTFLAEVSGALIQFEGEPAIQVMFRDISSEQEMRYEAQISKAVFRYSSEPMMVTDANGIIRLVNPAFTEETGFDADEVQGQKASVLSSGYHDQSFYRRMWLALMAEGEWEGEITNRKKSGELYVQRTHISAIRDANDEISQYICVMGDITEQKQELEKIRFQAMHDPLTKLPNRAYFIAEVHKALAEAKAYDQKLAVLFIDLDGFKPVNDTYGHLVGDQLLVAIAERLSVYVADRGLVARVGGDEFLVMLTGELYLSMVEQTAGELSALVAESLELDGVEISVGASVGAAVYPDHGDHELALINLADKAMYEVKSAGKGQAKLAAL
ncbi:sensor domain-containing diguanylate cyclase [Oceanospirillum sanctuarii]|uniref:sensor domain-containing diguanylate cyclase n=1 Tax=Oceanospirillum sanctuarii TaxID=1434821 RepID=UPI000A3A7AF7|nr:diguanylate cyclase [Oceanospirillum sanctuarii]